MSITEGNKLIAKFLGWVYYTKDYNWRYSRIAYATWRDKEGIGHKDLCFHSSWEWLMPVVEKIADCHYPDYYNGRERDPEQEGEWDDCAYPRTFGMRDQEGKYMVRINASTLFSAPTLIEATWLAVVDFVEWYNSEQEVQVSDTTKFNQGHVPNKKIW